MRRTANLPQLILHTTSAILLTLLTGFMGAPFLRVIRQSQGAWRYWLTGLIISTGFFAVGAAALAVFMASVWVTLGVYTELEDRGRGWWTSGLVGLLLGNLIAGVGLAGVLRGQGVKNWNDFVELIRQTMATLEQAAPDLKLDASSLAQQAPSVLVILLVLSLGTGLMFERRLFTWLGLPRERVASHLKLLEFRLPDFYIWIALTSFLLTMVDFGSKSVAALGANVVNVSIVLYFFQGLAVLEVLLRSLKAGFFIRALAYFFLVGQLFFVLSATGLIDYWADFRRRILGSGLIAKKG